MKARNGTVGSDQVQEPAFTKAQLVNAKLDFPRDVVMAVLEDGKAYTKDQAVNLINEFLARRV